MTPEQLAELEALAGGSPAEDKPVKKTPRPKRETNIPKKSTPRKATKATGEEFVINKGAPSTANATRLKWPFADMAVGHWFTVTVEENFHKARLSASAYGKRHNRRFTCMLMDNNTVLLVKRVR